MLGSKTAPWGPRAMYLVLIMLLLLMPSSAPASSSSGALHEPGQKETSQKSVLPEHLEEKAVDPLVAQMSDEQVRKHFIGMLKIKAAQESSPAHEADDSGTGRIFQKARAGAALIRQHLDHLQWGLAQAPRLVPKAWEQMSRQSSSMGPADVAVDLLVLILTGFVVNRFMYMKTQTARARLETSPACGPWRDMRSLFHRFLLDLAICVSILLSTAAVFFLFLDNDRSPFRHVVLLIYLAALAGVKFAHMILDFIFSPRAPSLRLVPVEDDTARFITQRVMILMVVVILGALVTAILELDQGNQTMTLMVDVLTSVILTIMVMALLWNKRKAISSFLERPTSSTTAGEGPEPYVYGISRAWLPLSTIYLLVLWSTWMFYLMVGDDEIVLPVAALVLFPFVFLAINWSGQKALQKVVDLLTNQSSVPDFQNSPVNLGENVDRQKYVPGIRRALSFFIAAFLIIWLLDVWGFEVDIEERVADAIFEILVAVILTILLWKLLENEINKRLKATGCQAHTENDEDPGKGGSRAATLLHILRKVLLTFLFIMASLIILSSLGINVGPLLAGAGVIGLAIGLGSQTLVHDIVSGLFFLMDDAFRIGDYIESGNIKGTVEHVSLRSVRLRHTRGMVHTVPFNRLGTVTNYSRDYIVDKLDLRVPFDTDIDKIRKIIKKINKQLQQDEEFGGLLLEPIKSQGIKSVDDSGMIMRVKFKTQPGEQFIIRREIFKRIQKAFEMTGIQFAHRHVVVKLPQDMAAEESDASGEAGAKRKSMALLEGGAAAAVALEVAAALEKEDREEKSDKIDGGH